MVISFDRQVVKFDFATQQLQVVKRKTSGFGRGLRAGLRELLQQIVNVVASVCDPRQAQLGCTHHRRSRHWRTFPKRAQIGIDFHLVNREQGFVTRGCAPHTHTAKFNSQCPWSNVQMVNSNLSTQRLTGLLFNFRFEPPWQHQPQSSANTSPRRQQPSCSTKPLQAHALSLSAPRSFAERHSVCPAKSGLRMLCILDRISPHQVYSSTGSRPNHEQSFHDARH